MKGSSRVQILLDPEFTPEEHVPSRSFLSCFYYIRPHCSCYRYFWCAAWGKVMKLG